MRQAFYLLCILLFSISGRAQSLFLGEVQDDFLEIPLTGVKISLLAADSTVVLDSIPTSIRKENGKISKVSFTLQIKGETGQYFLRATRKGYTDALVPIQFKKEQAGIYALDAPIRLRKSFDQELGEATVTATRLKVYYKGDTLVYDARAFKLPDGSMLDDLIHQLPGVTMNDLGEIYVNGRKVDELLLNSRSFFGGKKDVLLKNLPYYTVKDVRVYEQESRYARATGDTSLPKNYVMDVNLKDEFSRGYITNTEAAGGTDNRWLTRGFLLGFTKEHRFSMQANSNNVNEKRHIGNNEYWTPDRQPRSIQTLHNIAGEWSYESKDRNKKNNLYAEFSSSRNEGEMRQRQELFFNGSNPVSNTHSTTETKEDHWKLKNDFDLINIKSYRHITLGLLLEYKQFSGNSALLSEQYTDSLLHRQTSGGFNEGHAYNIDLKGSITPTFKLFRQGINANYQIRHNYEENNVARRYLTEQFVHPQQSTTFNANEMKHRNTYAKLALGPTRMKLSPKYELDIVNQISFQHDKGQDFLFHPDSLLLPSQIDGLQAITDPRNSYQNKEKNFSDLIYISLGRRKELPCPPPINNISYEAWRFTIMGSVGRNELDYKRGATDTLAIQRTISLNPILDLCFYPTQNYNESMTIKAQYNLFSPSAYDRINYTDDATPQVVKLGNSHLKNIAHSRVDIKYTDSQNKRKGQQYSIGTHFVYHHRSVANSLSYNPESGVYIYQPQNIRGAWMLNGQFNYSSPIDKEQRWLWQTNFSADYNHSVDHSMLKNETESRLNTVNTMTLSDKAWIQYQKEEFSLRLTGSASWRRSKGEMRDFSRLNAVDYNYGIIGRYTVPHIKTTLACDVQMYSRRGYGEATLNTDDFLINASLSQSLLKGMLIARIEAFDLLHQLSSTEYAINAQGRIETWFRSLPRYVMFHLVYHWNRNPQR